jgi:hypothetical protein
MIRLLTIALLAGTIQAREPLTDPLKLGGDH